MIDISNVHENPHSVGVFLVQKVTQLLTKRSDVLNVIQVTAPFHQHLRKVVKVQRTRWMVQWTGGEHCIIVADSLGEIF
jgi:hypothetical protein